MQSAYTLLSYNPRDQRHLILSLKQMESTILG